MPRQLCTTIILAAMVAGGLVPVTSYSQPEGTYSEYLIGVYLLESGDVGEAVDYFERAWRLSRHDPDVGLKLAESYYLLKNYTRCELVLDDILDTDPDEGDALMMKAKVRYIQRDRRSAVGFLERMRNHGGRSFEVERLLGNIYYELGEPKKALEAYDRCLAIDSSYPYMQYRYGRLLLIDGRVEDAEKAFRLSAELDPTFLEPTLALIELLVDEGREEEALPLLEDVVERDPRNEGALVALGNIYLERGRYEDGVALLERWREHSPFSQESNVLYGRLLFEAGHLDRALEVFDGMFEANPLSAELARILAEIRLKAGRPEEAREYFERAIAIDPADYRSYLALFFASTRRFAAAAGSEHTIEMTEDERRAILLHAAEYLPGSEFEANYLLGASFLSLDMLDDAERHLLRARELVPRDFQTLFNLASVYEKRGELDRAEPLLVIMLEDRPDDPTVLNFYGYLLSQMRKDLPRALDMLERALRAEPQNGYYLDSLGWIYYQMGDYARAVVELEKASEIVSDDPIILEHLGDAYAATRRFREARAAYERSHELQGGSEILEKIESATRKVR